MCRHGCGLGAILLTTMAICQCLAGTPARADHAQGESLSFLLYQNYLIVAQGSAGRETGLNFLLDTGTSPSILDTRLAARLHLQVAPAKVAVLNGSVHAGTATVPDLQLGPVHRERLPTILRDLSYLQNLLSTRIDGILGLDVLGQQDFVIDYHSHRIRFGPSPAMWASVPFQMRHGLPIVAATVNGEPVDLLLDTGCSSLVLFEEPHSSAERRKVRSISFAGPAAGNQQRFIDLHFGVAHFARKQVRLLPSQQDVGRDFAGIISPAALGITQLAVDSGAGMLAFSMER